MALELLEHYEVSGSTTDSVTFSDIPTDGYALVFDWAVSNTGTGTRYLGISSSNHDTYDFCFTGASGSTEYAALDYNSYPKIMGSSNPPGGQIDPYENHAYPNVGRLVIPNYLDTTFPPMFSGYIKPGRNIANGAYNHQHLYFNGRFRNYGQSTYTATPISDLTFDISGFYFVPQSTFTLYIAR